MITKAHILMRLILGLIVIFSIPDLPAQDLPGSSLPGSSTTIAAPASEQVPALIEKKELDPAMVKEIKDVVKTNIFAVSKRNINMALSTIHP